MNKDMNVIKYTVFAGKKGPHFILLLRPFTSPCVIILCGHIHEMPTHFIFSEEQWSFPVSLPGHARRNRGFPKRSRK